MANERQPTGRARRAPELRFGGSSVVLGADGREDRRRLRLVLKYLLVYTPRL